MLKWGNGIPRLIDVPSFLARFHDGRRDHYRSSGQLENHREMQEEENRTEQQLLLS